MSLPDATAELASLVARAAHDRGGIWAEQHRRPAHIEGRAEGTWVLLDYSDMLVHVLSEEEREYYALERLWGDCPAVPIDVDTEEARAAAAERAATHGAESAQ